MKPPDVRLALRVILIARRNHQTVNRKFGCARDDIARRSPKGYSAEPHLLDDPVVRGPPSTSKSSPN